MTDCILADALRRILSRRIAVWVEGTQLRMVGWHRAFDLATRRLIRFQRFALIDALRRPSLRGQAKLAGEVAVAIEHEILVADIEDPFEDDPIPPMLDSRTLPYSGLTFDAATGLWSSSTHLVQQWAFDNLFEECRELIAGLLYAMGAGAVEGE
jgi:hypothetical protein